MEAIAWVLGIGIGLYLLFRFPKPMLVLVVVVVGIVCVIVTGVWVFGEMAKSERSRVTLQVFFDTGGLCAADHPLLVTFSNRSSKTLTSVSFSIHAKRQGYSRDVYSDYLLSSDKILAPGEVHQACWALNPYREPLPHESLEWGAEVSSVYFDG